MNTCFVVSTKGSDEHTVYEFSAGVVSVIQNRNVRFEAADEAEAETLVQKNAPIFLSRPVTKIHKVSLNVGVYHRSIARPLYPGNRNSITNLDFDREKENIARVKREIRVLAQDLEECFDVSSPYKENLGVFGTWYESTILFACIGIENLFKKVLKDNGVRPVSKSFTMADFVKLKPVLKVDQYEARLARYPWLAPFKPFANWDRSKATQSLPWFDAYNALKHDKELSYARATMENAINACLAYWIVMHAVYGYAVDGRAWSSDDDDFYLTGRPSWRLNECYIKSADEKWEASEVTI